MSILTLLSMTAFSTAVAEPGKAPIVRTYEDMAVRVADAFRQSSVDAYLDLFPGLSELHSLMLENAALYGDFLPDAQKEFAERYVAELLPEARSAFERVLKDGIARGIKWSEIQFTGIEIDNTAKGTTEAAPVTIIFSFGGIPYRLRIENVLILQGNFRVGQRLALM